MVGGIAPKRRGQVVAHVGDGTTLVYIPEQPATNYQTAFEIPFPTELLPLDCRAIGSKVVVTWHPFSAVRWSEYQSETLPGI